MSSVASVAILWKHARALLDPRPEWRKHIVTLSMEYGDTAATIAADLTIREAETRLVAVLLRFAGPRRDGQAFHRFRQSVSTV
jgi:hypothetical protein